MSTQALPMPFGDARWANPKEVHASGLATESPGTFYLGNLVANDAASGQPIGYGTTEHLHVVLSGGSGGGKSARLAIPNLLHWQGGRSVIINDSTGELTATTAMWRSRFSRLCIVDPCDELGRLPGCEPLRRFRCGNNALRGLRSNSPDFNGDASNLAESIIQIEGTQKYFSRSACDLVALIIMAEVMRAEVANEAPQLSRVRDILAKPVGLKTLIESLASCGTRAIENKAGQFLLEGKSIEEIKSEALSQTGFLDDQPIADSLAAADGPDWASMKKTPTSVYLILPARNAARQTRWLRLVLTQAINALMSETTPGQLLTTFLLDEYQALCKGGLAVIENLLAYIRKYRCQLVPIVQDYNQLVELYPQLWQSFLANAGIIAHVGPMNDTVTAEYFSKRAGDTTVFTASSNQGNSSTFSIDEKGNARPSQGDSGGVSFSQTRVPFLPMHQLFGIPKGRVLVIRQGLRHVIQTEAKIYADPDHPLRLGKRADPNPFYHG